MRSKSRSSSCVEALQVCQDAAEVLQQRRACVIGVLTTQPLLAYEIFTPSAEVT